MSSPTLRLRIGSSRLRALLYGALCVLTGCALWSIRERGHGVTALLLMPPATWLLWRLRLDTAVGALLGWRAGVWTLEQNTVQRVIAPLSRSTATRWAIYLVFVDLSTGSTGSVWLFADSAPRSALRQLRVRLTLLR